MGNLSGLPPDEWDVRRMCPDGVRFISSVAFLIASSLTDVFIPYIGMRLDECREQLNALRRGQVDDFHAPFPEPFDSALKRAGFADHHGADPKLNDQPAAVPAWRQR